MTEGTDHELGEKILAASKVMGNILAEALMHSKAEGLSMPSYRVLDLVMQGTDKPADIARMLDVSPPAISWVLARLEGGAFSSGFTTRSTGGGSSYSSHRSGTRWSER